MNAMTYVRYEIKRTFRTRRFVLLAFGFPVVLYFLIAGPNRGEANLGGTGLSAPLYFMIGLVSFGAMNAMLSAGARIAFGAMNAMLSAGARIAGERQAGWNRQLRITPLTPRAYLRTKVLTGYVMAIGTMALMYAAGAILGVRLSAGAWVHMTWLILLGLVPFAALGILFGHLLSVDAVGPAMGGTTALLSFLGGVWFPIQHGALHVIAELLPSFWLVQASRVALGGSGWSANGWLVMGAWSVLLAAGAMAAYRRDTGRA